MRTPRPREPLGAGTAMTVNEAAIARSVLYASLFDYPLTLAQIRQTLVESVQTPTEIRAALEHSEALGATIEYQDGFFFPRGRIDLVAQRQGRESRSRAFLSRHSTFVRLVCAMPYVEMVALSGSIAHLNLDGDGDLDLCIVTKGHRVWSVTVAVVLLAKLLRRRRTVCANFVIADSALSLEQQDLFTASQILHLKPFSGLSVYRHFLAANPFVSRFYPNFHAADNAAFLFRPHRMLAHTKSGLERLLSGPSSLAERICRRAYRGYLQRRAATWTSPEQVRLESDCVKLHTHSHRNSVLARFDRAVRAVVEEQIGRGPGEQIAAEQGERELSRADARGSSRPRQTVSEQARARGPEGRPLPTAR